MNYRVDQASGSPAADDVVKGEVLVAKLAGRDAEEGGYRLRPQPQAQEHRPGAEAVDHSTVSEPDRDGFAAFGDDHVGAPIGHHPVIGFDGDTLLPEARDHGAPAGRWGPLTVDVRFVQDTDQSASENDIMDLRVDIITLAVPDLDEAHAFYVNRLGWQPALVIPGEVTFLLAGPGRMVGLFGQRDLERDIGDHESVPPFDLGQLFNTPAEVDAAVEAMVAAGARVRKPPQRPDFFEGYHAYVEAPDRTVWELLYNPGFHFDSKGAPHFASPE